MRQWDRCEKVDQIFMVQFFWWILLFSYARGYEARQECIVSFKFLGVPRTGGFFLMEYACEFNDPSHFGCQHA